MVNRVQADLSSAASVLTALPALPQQGPKALRLPCPQVSPVGCMQCQSGWDTIMDILGPVHRCVAVNR